jgi:hypothetical protein
MRYYPNKQVTLKDNQGIIDFNLTATKLPRPMSRVICIVSTDDIYYDFIQMFYSGDCFIDYTDTPHDISRVKAWGYMFNNKASKILKALKGGNDG